MAVKRNFFLRNWENILGEGSTVPHVRDFFRVQSKVPTTRRRASLAANYLVPARFAKLSKCAVGRSRGYYFGASDAMIALKRGSPRNGSQNGLRLRSP